MVGITTAGVRTDQTGQDSLCYGMYQHGVRVAQGEVDDPVFFMAWWEPSRPEADHRDPDTWRESNPGLEDLVDIEDLRSSLRTPENEFRTKRCGSVGRPEGRTGGPRRRRGGAGVRRVVLR
jgi:phage terminase large subunit-like protein